MKTKSIFSSVNSNQSRASWLVVIVGTLCMCAVTAHAQTQAQAATPKPTPVPTVAITFKDGKSVAATTLRRSGPNILATVPAGDQMAETPYLVSNIAKVEFPEPAQMQTTTDLLLKGNDAAALTQIEPIIVYYESYKDVPGSWWAAAARLKLKAFQDMHRDAAADALIDDMVKSAANPEASRLAGVLQAAALARKGEHDKAIAVYDDAIKSSTDDDTLAYAWVYKGASLYAQQQFDPALLAYLHVPVFYPDEKLLVPTVLLGSGKCYVRIENLPEAQKAFNDVIEQFPSSPEAIAAKAELKKLPKPTPSPDSATPTPSPDAAAASPAPSPATTTDSTQTTPAGPAATPAPANPPPANQ